MTRCLQSQQLSGGHRIKTESGGAGGGGGVGGGGSVAAAEDSKRLAAPQRAATDKIDCASAKSIEATGTITVVTQVFSFILV